LGQLISDPLNTASISYRGPTSQSTTKSHIEPNFTNIISHDDEGRLVSSITNASSIETPQDQLLLVSADEMEISILQSPLASLHSLLQDSAAHPFLRAAASKQQSLYYVVGIQTLRNPVFRKASSIQQGSSSFSSSPIAEAITNHKPAQLPIHVRRDSTLDIIDHHTGNNDAVIIGLQLVKVKCRVGRSDEPHVLEDLDFRWTYHRLDREGLQLAIGLGNKPLEPRELRQLAGIVVCGEDSVDGSYEDEEEDDDDFDDEGLAGF